jgi:ferredoxin
MAYVITRLCRDCVDGACVGACPVSCIFEHRPEGRESELPNQLFINPRDCIDCDRCLPECPWDAISREEDVPELFSDDVALNALSAERPSEFHVPVERLSKRPTPDEVDENKLRWGLTVKALGESR